VSLPSVVPTEATEGSAPIVISTGASVASAPVVISTGATLRDPERPRASGTSRGGVEGESKGSAVERSLDPFDSLRSLRAGSGSLRSLETTSWKSLHFRSTEDRP
jgi:hypothetical protein